MWTAGKLPSRTSNSAHRSKLGCYFTSPFCKTDLLKAELPHFKICSNSAHNFQMAGTKSVKILSFTGVGMEGSEAQENL